MKILVINCGSSSIKYKVFLFPQKICLSKGLLEHIGERDSSVKDHYSGLKLILEKIEKVSAVGHRVVHGAEAFKQPVVINEKVIRGIKGCSQIAPLHNPANLAGILACKRLIPEVPQVAVFDTAFHQTLPEYAYIYGLPYQYYKKYGIRKYGFHGTSHNYVALACASRLRKPLRRLKIITCHLGNGCSISAVKYGKSIDTSMGFTPLEGLVMGTRCGDIDPALVTFIMQKERCGIGRIEQLLNKESGLLGISGISNDMRVVEHRARLGDERCQLAIDVFVYRIKKYIGSYIAVMGGCDALVFTGGIGENQIFIRKKICTGLFDCLRKKPAVLVIPTDEELMIAYETHRLVKKYAISKRGDHV